MFSTICTKNWTVDTGLSYGTICSVGIPGRWLQNTADVIDIVAFGAASVLLAASLCPELGVSLELEPAKTSWEKALQIFDYHKTDVESAEKGIQVLKMYYRQIWAANNYGESNHFMSKPQETDKLLIL